MEGKTLVLDEHYESVPVRWRSGTRVSSLISNTPRYCVAGGVLVFVVVDASSFKHCAVMSMILLAGV